MKKNNNKGFTLMEMLIVVAIIAILVAIAIPTFSGQLTKAKQAADNANVRAAYAEAMAKFVTEGGKTVQSAQTSAKTQAGYDGSTKIGDASITPTWSANQTVTVTVTPSEGKDFGATVTIQGA